MCKIALLLTICVVATASAIPDYLEFYQERIIGGALATTAQHPYAASILYASNNVNFLPVCGGAIVNSRSIVTAQSCWNSPNIHVNQFRVRVGSVNTTTGGSLIVVSRLISHPNYEPWNQANNIGIVRLNSVITFGVNVKPIQVATSNYNLADFQYVWAIGWGRTTAASQNSELLRAVEIRTINQGRCENIYGLNFINLNQVCAGWEAGSRGSCLGDVGSPLIHNQVLVGVTAYTFGCGDGNYPSVYTRVSRYFSWIQANA